MMTTQTDSTMTIRTARPAEAEAIVTTVTMAFAADPAARWMYPEARQYMEHFPRFVRAMGGKALLHGSACLVGNAYGAAMWLPPDVLPDEDMLTRVLESTVSSDIRADIFAIFEQMGSYHPPVPHWYLPLIGVDLPYQGQGYGSALLRHTLEKCDREGMPAYLESSNPKNVPLYERHGFTLMGEIRAGSSPPILPMLRRPL